MGFYEDFTQKVAPIGTDKEDAIREIKVDMEVVNDNICSAKEALETAYRNGDASEYMRLKAVIEINEIRLIELEKKVATAKGNEPLSAAEHKQFVDELKNHTVMEVTDKYNQLLKLLDSGKTVLYELDEIIQKYYAAFSLLDSKVLDFETDSTGAKYRTFSNMDVHRKLDSVERVFLKKGMHSIRNAIEHAIESKTI